MNTKKALLALATISCLVIGLWPGHSLAASGVIYVSPATSSVQVGNTVSVSIRINPGTTVNAVQATMTYNATDLQYVSTSLGVFSTCVQNSGGGGSVTLSCAELGSSTSSDSLIATITFTALASSGSANLGLTNAEAAYNGSYTDPASTGGSISFTAPAATPNPTPSPTPISPISGSTKKSSGGTSTATTPSTPTPSPTPAATTPKIALTAKLQATQFTTAGILVSTNIPVQAHIEYGTTKDDLSQSTTPTTLDKTSNLPLPASLTPGTTYYYKVVAVAGNQTTTSSVQSLTTKGFTVSVLVLDTHYHPLIGKTITLHSTAQTAQTNQAGIVTFKNAAPGTHHIEYSTNGHTYSETVYVYNNLLTGAAANQTAPVQDDTITLTGLTVPQSKGPNTWAIAISSLIVVVLAVYSIYRWTPLLKPLKARAAFGRLIASRYTVSEIADIEKYIESKESETKTTPVETKDDKAKE